MNTEGRVQRSEVRDGRAEGGTRGSVLECGSPRPLSTGDIHGQSQLRVSTGASGESRDRRAGDFGPKPHLLGWINSGLLSLRVLRSLLFNASPIQSARGLAHFKPWRLVAAVVRRRLTSPWRHAQHSISRALTSAATLLALGFALTAVRAHAQSFAIDWFSVDGGGGTSTNGQYTFSGTIGQPDAGPTMTGGQFTLTGGFWVLPTLVQTPGAPTLTIVPHAPGFALISWSPPTPGFVLQENLNLVSTNWVYSLSGTTNPVIVPATPPTRFYRLHKP